MPRPHFLPFEPHLVIAVLRASAPTGGASRKACPAPPHKPDFTFEAVHVMQTLVTALGAGLGVWGIVNLLEGYGNDNPGAKSQGMKQLMAGGGMALVGSVLVPLLSGLFG